MNKIGKILAIDLGLKNIGLAISDDFGLSIRGLKNLSSQSREVDKNNIIIICIKEKITKLIIGYPCFYKNNRKNIISHRAFLIFNALRQQIKLKILPFKVYLLDESYSSKRAKKRLILSGVSRKKKKCQIDSESARIILKDYLIFFNSNG